MKKIIALIFVMVGTYSVHAQGSIAHVWNTGMDNTTIEIKLDGSTYEGKIVSSDKDMASPGKLIVKDVKKTKETYKGKLYAIKRNKWVDATFEPKGNSLLVTVSVGWRTKKLEWKKER